jgi:hypothetical protein
LLPRLETGKINRVHRPCCGRLSPGAAFQRMSAPDGSFRGVKGG